MSGRARLVLIAAALVVAVGGFALARSAGDDDGDSKDSTTATAPAEPARTPQEKPAEPAKPEPPPVPEIVVRDGEPVGGVRDITVERGERVRFTVSSDTADEVHVHGYDLTFDVPAGGKGEVDFEADADGQYEVELHDAAEQIASLRVEP